MESDDRQALAAFEAAGGDDFAATLGGHAGAKTNLAGSLNTVRTESGLHVCLSG